MRAERFRNFFLLLGSNLVSKGAWALALILLLRALGPSEYGKLATLWALGAIASSFTDLGTTQVLVREGTRHPPMARLLGARILFLQISITLLGSLLLLRWVSSAIALDLPPHTAMLVAATGSLTPLLDRFQTLFTAFSQVSGKYRAYAGLRSLYFLLILIGFLFISQAQGTILTYSIFYFSTTVVAVVISGLLTWRLLPAPASPDMPPTAYRRISSDISFIKAGLPFLAIGLLTLAYGRAEVSILGFMEQMALAGAFHAIYQLIQLIYSISGIFFTITYPRLYGHKGDKTSLSADYRDTARWLSFLAYATAPLLWLYGREILQLIGGDDMGDFASLLNMLALLVILLPASAALNFLLPLDRPWQRVLCDAAGISFTVVGTLVVVQLGSPESVGIIAVLGYALSTLLANLFLRKVLTKPFVTLFSEWLLLLPASLSSALLTYLLHWHWLAGSISYLVMLIAFLWLSRHPVILKVKNTVVVHRRYLQGSV